MLVLTGLEIQSFDNPARQPSSTTQLDKIANAGAAVGCEMSSIPIPSLICVVFRDYNPNSRQNAFAQKSLQNVCLLTCFFTCESPLTIRRHALQVSASPSSAPNYPDP
jgi:hypothetical protein